MFVDICDSTERIAKSHPEEGRSFLKSAIALMREVIEGSLYEGYVAQTLGDGVLALFGVPLSQEDHAVRACRAAIELQRRATESKERLLIRVGIDSGQVMVGPDEHGLPVADGLPLHRASRLEKLSLPGKILVSDSTFRLVEGEVAAISLGRRSIRGLEGETELFELSSADGQSSSAAWARDRYLTERLVGRDELLAGLEGCARQALQGALRVVGLRGEPGIGKSRVVAEFHRRIRSDGVTALSVTARPYANHLPYRLIADLARELIRESVDRARLSDDEALREAVRGWRGTLARCAPAVIDLLDLGDAGSDWRALTPAQRGRRIADALHLLVRERLAAGPLVVVIEDVFRMDRASQRVLDAVLRRLETGTVFVCLTYRQDFINPWSDDKWFLEQHVGPLSRVEMSRLASAMLGHDESIGGVVHSLVERAEGNPFFFEQMALTLINDGTLVGSRGAYRSGHPAVAPAVPASISALVNARVDRLPREAKATLQAASVLGEPIISELLGAMRDVPTESADDGLNVCVDAGLLTAPPADGEPRFGFRHGLVQETVRAALTRTRRKELHNKAFSALKDHLRDQADDHAAVLAHHAYQGESWTEAADYALKAMSRSIARSANRDALRLFDLGLNAVRRIEKSAASLSLELAIRLEALGALLPLGQMEAIVSNLERAEVITKEIGDKRREAAVLVQLAVIRWAQASYDKGLRVAANAGEAAREAGSRSLQMAAVQARMMLNHGLGYYRQVAADAKLVECTFALELGARRMMPGWAVIAAVNVKVFLADAMRRLQQIDAAQQACDAAYRELSSDDHAFSRVMTDFVQVAIWIDQERYAEAVSLLRSAARSCQVNDVPTMYPAIVAALGGAMARAGEAAEAITLLQDAVAQRIHLTGGRYNDVYLPLNLGVALNAAGRHEEAVAAAWAARTAAATHGQRGHLAEALYTLAEFELAAGRRAAEAAAHFEEARALAALCGMVQLERRASERVAQVASALEMVKPADSLAPNAQSHG